MPMTQGDKFSPGGAQLSSESTHHEWHRLAPATRPGWGYAQVDDARHVIHHEQYRCTPRHPPHNISVIATSSTSQCTGRHVIHHI